MQRLFLEGEDVVQHPLDTPPFEPVVRDQSGPAEQPPQFVGKRGVDPHLAGFESLLENDQALVENLQPLPPLEAHRASTRTRPASTLTWKVGSGGTE